METQDLFFRRAEVHPRIQWVVLAFLAAFIAVWRIPVIFEPLERDVMLWAVMAKQMLAGGRIYTDFWDQRPPGLHVSYAGAFLIFGYNQFALYAVSVFFAWTGLAGAYFSGCRFARDPRAGLLAALFWALICGDGLLFANQAKCELMVNACMLCAFAALAGRDDEPIPMWRQILAGFLLSLAVLWFKFNSVFMAAGLLTAHLVVAGKRWKEALHECLVAGGCMLLFAFCFVAYFKFQGRYDDLKTWVVDFNRGYSGSFKNNLVEGLRPNNLMPAFFRFVLPLAGLSIAALVLALLRRRFREVALLTAWAIGTYLSVALPGHLWPHYYQLWLPFLSVGGAMGLCYFWQEGSGLARKTGLLAGIACLAILCRHDALWMGLSSKEWCERQYGDQAILFEKARDFGANVDHLLKPDETFFLWGIDPGVYFASKRSPPTSWMSNIFDQADIADTALKEWLMQKTIKQLRESQPEMIVIQTYVTPLIRWTREPILRWVAENYLPLPGQSSDYFQVFMKRNGALEKRTLKEIQPMAVYSDEYEDGRSHACIRMEAKDEGIVLHYGGGPNECDSLGARDAIVFNDGEKYYMHYDGAGPQGWTCVRAESKNLKDWNKIGPILELGKPGEWDQATASYGVTFHEGSIWHLFYVGAKTATSAPNLIPVPPYFCLKATASSPEGPWTKQPQIMPFQPKPGTYYANTASPGQVLKTQDGYIQFFSAMDQKRTLGIARTKDLNSAWSVDPQPILPSDEQIENSSVYFEQTSRTWFLFTNHVGIENNVEFTDAVWVYWSHDLEHWSVEHKFIALDGKNCKSAQKCIGLPSVLPVGNRLALFYDSPGGDSTSHMRRNIGLAWLDLPLKTPDSVTVDFALKILPNFAPPGKQYVIGIEQGAIGGITPELTKGTVLEEDVLCDRSNLSAIEVMLATFARINSGKLVLEVFDDQKRKIGSRTAEMQNLDDNTYVHIPVVPVGDSSGKLLTIRISSPDGETGHSMMAWSSKTKSCPSGNFRINGVPVESDLTFRLIHTFPAGAVLKKTTDIYGLIQNEFGNFTTELTRGQTLDQDFLCTQPGLAAVEIRMATFGRQNSGKIVFTVFDAERKKAGELVTDMSTVKDNGYIKVPLSDAVDSANKRFSIHVESPDGAPNNAVMVWASKRDAYPGGELRINGKSYPFDMTFRLIHRITR